MLQSLPRFSVGRAPQSWAAQPDPAAWDWADVPRLSLFILADGSGPARQQTIARVCHDGQALYVRYDCDDNDIWGTYTQRDEAIYDEEVVEIFIGPGEADMTHYFEFQVSPNAVLLDARVHNPTWQRAELNVDISWNCPGIRWWAGRNDALNHWWAMLMIPWAAIAPPGELPSMWRANFYRIERPRQAAAEFSCWSPTLTEPADFHKPAHFGILDLR